MCLVCLMGGSMQSLLLYMSMSHVIGLGVHVCTFYVL